MREIRRTLAPPPPGKARSDLRAVSIFLPRGKRLTIVDEKLLPKLSEWWGPFEVKIEESGDPNILSLTFREPTAKVRRR